MDLDHEFVHGKPDFVPGRECQSLSLSHCTGKDGSLFFVSNAYCIWGGELTIISIDYLILPHSTQHAGWEVQEGDVTV